MEYKDYYKILGVDRKATTADIKKNYRRLARKYHPDVSKEPNAEARFKELGEAYEVLRDSEKRRAYDQLGANWRAGQDFRPPPGWQDPARGYAQGGFRSGPGAGSGGFSDFFESLFGGGGFAQAPRSRGFEARGFEAVGADQQASLEITLEEAYQGARKSLRFENGKSLDVRLPAGATPGQRVRLAGQGSPGMGGGPPGDLYLEVQIAPHDYFRLDGRDVLLDLPVTPWEAALGATITAPTLGGKVEVKVPAGSGSGRKLRLKWRGLPGSTPGDQLVIVQIHTPPANTETARDLYRRMAEELPFDPRSHLR
ncbi:MAG: DnaJ domain-containing protein [Gammaproteobacteria bacterium]|nr:DnaJ domain-containing protein [Gammaproteobacteria bacterium]